MTLEEENARLRAENVLVAHLQEQLVAALARIAELERERHDPPPFVKPNKPPRKKRDPRHNHARRRETPTQIVLHALDRCLDCHYQLCGDSIDYTRQVIELPQQENIIRDFLIPLGIDTNHGYRKTIVENSEVAKQRTTLAQRRDRLQQWADSARKRYQHASRRADRRYAHRKERGDIRYRELNRQHDALHDQGVYSSAIRRIMRERKAEIDAEIEELMAQYWHPARERDAEWRKIERYCQDQRIVLQKLGDLNTREQQMYELNNDKDQVMTVCKVALAIFGATSPFYYLSQIATVLILVLASITAYADFTRLLIITFSLQHCP